MSAAASAPVALFSRVVVAPKSAVESLSWRTETLVLPIPQPIRLPVYCRPSLHTRLAVVFRVKQAAGAARLADGIRVLRHNRGNSRLGQC
jgi:hypothetical protein